MPTLNIGRVSASTRSRPKVLMRPRGSLKLRCSQTPTRSKVTLNQKSSFKGGVCTSITARTVEEAKQQVVEAEASRADTVEFRLDFLEDFTPNRDLVALLQSTRLPYIVTYRPNWEGGRYDGKEDQRLWVLKESAKMGAPFIDIELKAAGDFFAGGGVGDSTAIILSHHDNEMTPEFKKMEAILEQMYETGADIAKIATTVQDITDCKRLLALLQQQTRPAIVIGMGERGLMTRVLAPKYGGFLTFGALASGKESAPGQPTVNALRDMYRVQNICPATKVFGVIGNPIAHSKSPLFHNACFDAAGMDAVYLPLLVDDFDKYMKTFTDQDFVGYNVTIPHKESALIAAHQLDDVAKSIGCCNVLVRDPEGEFNGHNTDWTAIGIIEEGMEIDRSDPLNGATVVMIGAGGVAKAIAYGAVSKGAQLIIANRTMERAEALAANFDGCRVVSMEEVNRGEVKGDVLVNATSLGMEPNETTTPIAKELLSNFSLVFDSVYTPRDTRLLREAAEMGCKTASGEGLFVRQASQSFQLFTGSRPNEEVIQKHFSD